ncbi:glycerol-3-phosphate dehydrogenase [Novosphingopyxis sp.]|uniref:glycerol-3-phosphate dehydrogenase n=1 Tax=Novosphingopyxis sp. TaxID=2709690 RepID=UPI003B59EC06
MYDLAIIGGGVNGCGIARDAAGRGLSVVLLEKDDLAAHTSSAATKLIHGGLRYLEQYEFRLVRKALKEREVLLRAAPHIIWPLRFVLPIDRGMRPAWMLRIGLFLYDHLGGREWLPATRRHDLTTSPWGAPLEARLKRGFSYSDCWVEDARLVVLNALDARERGADIRTRTACTGLVRRTDRWLVSAGEKRFEARALVNAAGPWADAVAGLASPDGGHALRLVKGSHIVVRKAYEGDQAYIFQNGDGRVIFAIPYERDFTLIGTTDRPHGDPDRLPEASAEEIAYLIDAANGYLARDLTGEDVVWTYSGVRPLYDDHEASASEVTRDYVLKLDCEGGAPILSVLGGKLTTYRVLAQEALDRLGPLLGNRKPAWTAHAALPGGDFLVDGFDALAAEFARSWPWLGEETAARYARAYGTRTRALMHGADSAKDMGILFGAGLSEREARYLITEEFACTAADILWRRTKLGLHLSEAERVQFVAWMERGGAANPD